MGITLNEDKRKDNIKYGEIGRLPCPFEKHQKRGKWGCKAKTHEKENFRLFSILWGGKERTVREDDRGTPESEKDN